MRPTGREHARVLNVVAEDSPDEAGRQRGETDQQDVDGIDLKRCPEFLHDPSPLRIEWRAGLWFPYHVRPDARHAGTPKTLVRFMLHNVVPFTA